MADNPYAQYANPYAVYGPGPNRFKVRDQELQEEANRRAEEAARRADRAEGRANRAEARADITANKPAPIPGYEGWFMGPDGKPFRPEELPEKPGGGNPLPAAVAQDFKGKIGALSDLSRAINTFQDDFSGAGAGVESLVQGVTGLGTPGQRDWWADFKRTDNITRNALFGASLSEGERAAYQATTIHPNMTPAEIRRNLDRRLQIARDVLTREREFLQANGYRPEAIDALMGGVNLNAAPMPAQEAEGELRRRISSGEDPADTIQWLISVGRPPNKEEIAAIIANAGNPRPDVRSDKARAAEIKAQRDELYGPAGGPDLAHSGAMFGLGDEAAGIGQALSNAVTSPFTDRNFDPVGEYQAGRDAERMRLDEARQRLGGGGTALEIAGGMGGAGVAKGLQVAPTLLGRMGQGAKAGAATGGVGGFGYGEGVDSLSSAAVGAAGGAVIGGAVPPVIEVIGNRAAGLKRMVGRDPELPRRMVADAIQSDGMTPKAAGAMMDDAATRGSPMMLADTGENTRGLLASVSRHPGPARRLGKEATIERQKASAERISEAVVRDLGPTANINELGEALIERARTASAPFYQKFESAPGASVVKLDDLATRPAFQKALKKAVDLSREEGVDPTALGFRFNDAGEMILDREAISWRSMDYIKRALDDVIEANKDQRGQLTQLGRAAYGTKKGLVARMDKANPAYAQARAAYAGPAAMRDAVEQGHKALSKSPDDIMAEMKLLGEGEKEAYRLGVRKAVVDLVNSMKDGGDKVNRLLGTPKSRAALSRIFGGGKEFQRFIQTLRDEEAMGLTYKAVNTGSPTAERMAADATTNDTGLAESALDAVVQGARGGSMWSSLVAGLQHLRDVDKFGAGKAGEATRESIAALLSETDPAVLKELVRAANRAAAKQRMAAGKRSRSAVSKGRTGGLVTGYSAGQISQQP